MAAFYPNGAPQETTVPRCPACGEGSWEATRPARLSATRHPQERKGWVERGVGVFVCGLSCAGALTMIAALGADALPGWALWLLVASAVSGMLVAVVIVDGLAVESKSCAFRCVGCGAGFVAPWRPRD